MTPDSAFCRSRSIRESGMLRLQTPVGELQSRGLFAFLKIPCEAHDGWVARRLALFDPGIDVERYVTTIDLRNSIPDLRIIDKHRDRERGRERRELMCGTELASVRHRGVRVVLYVLVNAR